MLLWFPWKGRTGWWQRPLLALAGSVFIICGGVACLAQSASLGAPGSTSQSPLGQPPWVKAPPAIANTILHWRQVTSSYVQGGIDPSNGKQILGDIWEQIGGNGQIMALHARYTYLDGTFHQEIFEDETMLTVIEGQDYLILQPSTPPKNWCIEQQPTDLNELHSHLPPFIDEAILAQEGFQMSEGALSMELPTTPSLEQVTPIAFYPSHPLGHVWVRQEPGKGNALETNTLEVSPQDRLLAEESAARDAHGTILSSSSLAIGPLYVYAKASVPPSVLTRPNLLTGGCHS